MIAQQPEVRALACFKAQAGTPTHYWSPTPNISGMNSAVLLAFQSIGM